CLASSDNANGLASRANISMISITRNAVLTLLSFFRSDMATQSSIRFRQPQYFLGDEAHDQLRADGCDPRDEALTQIAFDMILLGVPHAAQRQHGCLAGIECSFGSQELGRVGELATRHASVIKPCR